MHTTVHAKYVDNAWLAVICDGEILFRQIRYGSVMRIRGYDVDLNHARFGMHRWPGGGNLSSQRCGERAKCDRGLHFSGTVSDPTCPVFASRTTIAIFAAPSISGIEKGHVIPSFS